LLLRFSTSSQRSRHLQTLHLQCSAEVPTERTSAEEVQGPKKLSGEEPTNEGISRRVSPQKVNLSSTDLSKRPVEVILIKDKSEDDQKSKEEKSAAKANPKTLTVPAASIAQAFTSVTLLGLPLLGSTVKLQLKITDEKEEKSIVATLKVDQTLLDKVDRGEAVDVQLSSPKEVEKDLPSQVKPFNQPRREAKKKFAHQCNVCQRLFSRPSHLQRHQRTHSSEKPFVCSEDCCGRSFTQQSSLKLHVLAVHGGKRPHVCPFCTYPFSQKANLKKHVARAHGEAAARLSKEMMAK